MNRFIARHGCRPSFIIRTAVLSSTLSALACDPAGTVKVTSTADGGTGSLRAAIATLNASSVAERRIELATGTYELTLCGSDDANAVGDLDVSGNTPVTIVATGSDVVIRQTCAGERVLEAHGSGALTLIGVRITGGSLTGTVAGQPSQGGGVRAAGDVKLENVTFSGNSVSAGTGAGARAGGEPVTAGGAYGGGLYVAGALRAKDSIFELNSATGGIGADAPASDGQSSSGGVAEGGGAYVVGSIDVQGGSLSQNRTVGGAAGLGGVRQSYGGSARGGGLAQRSESTAAAVFAGVTLTGNSVENGAAAYGMVIPPYSDGSGASGGALAVSGPLRGDALTVTQNAALGGVSGLRGCTTGNPCSDQPGVGTARGGAIAGASSVTLTASSLSSNRAVTSAESSAGGAVWAVGTLTLTDAVLSENSVNNEPLAWWAYPVRSTPNYGGGAAGEADVIVQGGQYTKHSADLGRGGAISGKTVTVSNVSFSANAAFASGGAIAADTLTATRVTASGNRAGRLGGGAFGVELDATIADSQIHGNEARGAEGGGGIRVGGHLAILRSVVSNNKGTAANVSQYLLGSFSGGGIEAGSVAADSVTVANNEIFGRSSSAGITGGGAIAASGTVRLVNSTLDANRVVEPFPYPVPAPGTVPNRGAAILAAGLELVHSTIADNAGLVRFDSIGTFPDAPAPLPALDVNTLTAEASVVIAARGASACAAPPVTTGSYNWLNDASCGFSGSTNQQSAADFLLGPLADNGGVVTTRAPALASVLVERVPAASCGLGVDARGVTRPQGTACDVGAVELQIPPGLGVADLTVSFPNPPDALTPGLAASWQVTVANRGPTASLPVLELDVPTGVTLTSVTATDGTECSLADPAICAFRTPLAVGGSVTVTFTGQFAKTLTGSLELSAELIARDLVAPFDDDRAVLAVPLRPVSGLSAAVSGGRWYGQQEPTAFVQLFNSGPSAVIGTEAQPVTVIFHPAPGVAGWPVTPDRLVGTFDTIGLFGTMTFQLKVNTTREIPAVLGMIEIRADATVHDPIPQLPVLSADLEFRALRSSAAQAPGDPTNFSLEVVNNGPNPASGVALRFNTNGGLPIEWSPALGEIVDGIWRLPSLAPGQTATLAGVGRDAPINWLLDVRWHFDSLTASLGTPTPIGPSVVDPVYENDQSRLDLSTAPRGTADLRVDSIELLPGDIYPRTIRAVVTNAGPAINEVDPAQTSLQVLLRPAPEWTLIEARAIRNNNWSCGFGANNLSCISQRSMRAGERVAFEFVVGGSYPEMRQAYVEFNGGLTPDHNPSNNRRYLNVSIATQQ